MTLDVDWYNKYHIIDKISWKESKINIPVFSTLLYCDIVLIASCNQLDHEVLFGKHLVLTQTPDRQKIYHPVLIDLIWPFSFFIRRQDQNKWKPHESESDLRTTLQSDLPISFEFDVDFYPSQAWVGKIKCRMES